MDDFVVTSNAAVVYGHVMADNDETNDCAQVLTVGDDSVEERFRVDRRKLEQLIQGGRDMTSACAVRCNCQVHHAGLPARPHCNLVDRSKETIIPLYKSLVRSHIE